MCYVNQTICFNWTSEAYIYIYMHICIFGKCCHEIDTGGEHKKGLETV